MKIKNIMKTIMMTNKQYNEYRNRISQDSTCDKWEVIRSIMNLETDNFIIQSAILTDNNRESLETLIITLLD